MKNGAIALIVNACIWGAIMIGCSLALKGTDGYEKIQNILVGGASFSLIVAGALVAKTSKTDDN